MDAEGTTILGTRSDDQPFGIEVRGRPLSPVPDEALHRMGVTKEDLGDLLARNSAGYPEFTVDARIMQVLTNKILGHRSLLEGADDRLFIAVRWKGSSVLDAEDRPETQDPTVSAEGAPLVSDVDPQAPALPGTLEVLVEGALGEATFEVPAQGVSGFSEDGLPYEVFSATTDARELQRAVGVVVNRPRTVSLGFPMDGGLSLRWPGRAGVALPSAQDAPRHVEDLYTLFTDPKIAHDMGWEKTMEGVRELMKKRGKPVDYPAPSKGRRLPSGWTPKA